MSDFDREPERVRETDRTTTIITDGGRDRGGSGGVIAAVLLLLVLLVLGFLFFGGGFNKAADKVGVNVNVPATKVELPDVNVKIPDKIEVPNVKVETRKSGDGNASR
jgi:hypothetical protein